MGLNFGVLASSARRDVLEKTYASFRLRTKRAESGIEIEIEQALQSLVYVKRRCESMRVEPKIVHFGWIVFLESARHSNAEKWHSLKAKKIK